jgi:zinc transport system substrate-binding protein
MKIKLAFTNSYVIIAIIAIFSFGCSSENNKEKRGPNESDKPLVCIVNYPLYFFATEIGGEFIDVFMPSTKGDPASWNPDNPGIEKFQKADLILLNGADYAKWVNDISLPAAKIVNTSETFKDEYIVLEEAAVHRHGPEGEHSHKGFAFTTWVDLNYAVMQAEAVKEALIKIVPENKEMLESNFEALKASLNKLDKELSNSLKNHKGLEVFASHPVYQYLGKRYNLNIISYHWEPDRMPSEDEWKGFEDELDHHTARIMLWEDEPLPETRNRLENMGVSIVVYNPGGNLSDKDFLSLMKQNIEDLKVAIK